MCSVRGMYLLLITHNDIMPCRWLPATNSIISCASRIRPAEKLPTASANFSARNQTCEAFYSPQQPTDIQWPTTPNTIIILQLCTVLLPGVHYVCHFPPGTEATQLHHGPGSALLCQDDATEAWQQHGK